METYYKNSKLGTYVFVIAVIILIAIGIFSIAKSICDKTEVQQTIQSDNTAYTVLD